jgi:hypothetical protein
MTRASLTLAVLAVAALVSASPAAADLVSRPSIESESISHITSTDATLEATINPNGLKTTYQFHLYSGCLPPAACLAITPYPLSSGEIPASSEPQPVSVDLNSAGVTLKPDTRYAYSVEATNAAGTSQGAENQFTTLGPPVIESESVSNITETDSTLEAQINTEGAETTYEFQLRSPACSPPAQCIPIISYPLPSGKLLGSSIGQSVSIDLNSAGVTLQPAKEYFYSVTATNAAGTTEGTTQTFTTPSEPGVEPLTEPSGSTDPQTSTTVQSPSSSSAPHHRRHHRRHKRGLHQSELHRARHAG